MVKRSLTSITFGFVIWGIVFYWIKSFVYAQGEAALSPIPSFSIAPMALWIIGGGLASLVISFLRAQYRMFKEDFDFLAAGLSLLLLSPLFLVIAILIKSTSEGPVFLRQKRMGRRGVIFNILKFRTMRNNAESGTGPVWAQSDDPRVTKVGRFLRKSHLDELPQLINVAKGEMSLIGPRPERPEFVEAICKHIPDFEQRLDVKPGITGLAQVHYRYCASIKDAARKLKYDLIYINKMCWLLDFRIILWTVKTVLTGEGAR